METRRKRNARKSSIANSSPLFTDNQQFSSDSPAPPNKVPKPSRRSMTGGKSLHSDSPPAGGKPLSSIADLKEMVSSRIHDIKSNLIDRSHAEIVNDLEASGCRLHKRLKVQSQASQQLMDESEKQYKKIIERITESSDAITESYDDFTADLQSTTARVCKSTIPDLSKSFERMINDLQDRYGTHCT